MNTEGHCHNCRRKLQAHFDITYTGRDGVKRPQTVTVCSIKCLVGWAYRYAAEQGARSVMMFRAAIGKVQEIMKGGGP